MLLPGVSVGRMAGLSPQRVDALLGAALAVGKRVPVACGADAIVLKALGMNASPGLDVVSLTPPNELMGQAAWPATEAKRCVLAAGGDAEAKRLAEDAKKRDAEVALVLGAEMFETEGQTLLYQLERGVLKRRRIRPADCGLPDNDPALLAASGAEASARALEGVTAGRGGGHNQPPSIDRAIHHAVVINAALILLAAGVAVSLQDGAEMAKADIAAGAMKCALDALRGGAA